MPEGPRLWEGTPRGGTRPTPEMGGGRQRFAPPFLSGFMRQENKIRGNTRTVRRQYAARNWTFTRVLPGIAGYCRVVGPGEISSAEFEVRNGAGRQCLGSAELLPTFPDGSYRFVPAGTAWYRIKFFAGGACTQYSGVAQKREKVAPSLLFSPRSRVAGREWETAAFFGPFLSWKGLVSRRLGRIRGKISQQAEPALNIAKRRGPGRARFSSVENGLHRGKPR
jgi:hypothetical protein